MTLHPALANDTSPVHTTQYSQILLMDDSRWPWFILVPIQPGINELHDLNDDQRSAFMADVNHVSRVLQNTTGCRSVNVAMLGNVVSQLHCHVVARETDDPAWPKPVWGFENRISYADKWPESLTRAMRSSFS